MLTNHKCFVVIFMKFHFQVLLFQVFLLRTSATDLVTNAQLCCNSAELAGCSTLAS